MKITSLAPIPALMLALISCLPLTAEIDEALFNQAELDQMLAPIALYPDVLLSQVLMAATYPLEVVEASRWTKANPELEGDEAVQAVEEMDWDESIKALVGFPELIQLMDENLTWTRRLGDAFLLQAEQVMESTQNLRKKSLETGNLASMEHVTVEQKDNVIVIEPAEVQVIYVPYYSPYVVYGNWWWYNYPPIYWGPMPVYYSSVGYHWGRGISVSMGFYYSSCDWYSRSVVIRNPHRPHKSPNPPHWKHNPHHRRGVAYRSEALNKNYHRGRVSGSNDRNRPSRDNPHQANATNKTRKSPNQSGRVARNDRSENPSRTSDARSPRERKSVVARSSKGEGNRSANTPGRTAKPNRTEKRSTKPAPPPSSSTSNRNVASTSSSSSSSNSSSSTRWTYNSRVNTGTRQSSSTHQRSSNRPQKRTGAP